MPTHLIWIAYSLSNMLALLLLWASWKKPAWARVGWFLLFASAAWFNAHTALTSPALYTGYAQYAFFSIYENFINGFFAEHTTLFVLAIAVGQAGIAFGMVAGGKWLRVATFGGIVFLLSIAPLGLGAAFPATLIMAAGLLTLSFIE